MQTAARRAEDRTPLKVAVDLSSLDVRATAQRGVTENVSPRGARVLTSRAWRQNDRLNLRSMLGTLRSRARVVYCEAVGSGTYAIGLELSVTIGEWSLQHESAAGKTQKG